MAHPVWQLVRGGNVIVGTSTVTVGALMVTTTFTDVELALVILHSVCVATFMASWNTFNDIQDHENDLINHPERPIPRGALTLVQAKSIGRGSFLLSLISLLSSMGVAALYSETLVSWLPSIGIWLVAVLLMFHYEIVSPRSLVIVLDKLKEIGISLRTISPFKAKAVIVSQYVESKTSIAINDGCAYMNDSSTKIDDPILITIFLNLLMYISKQRFFYICYTFVF